VTMLKRLDFNNNPYLGVYCKANDQFAFIDPLLGENNQEQIAASLQVDIITLGIGGSSIIGSLIAMNSHGAVVTDFIIDKELEKLHKHFDGNVLVIKDTFNAAGNNILVNDIGAIVHPMLQDDTINDINDVMDVEVQRGTISSIKTVGMVAVATNKGILCHPKVTDEEKEQLKTLFRVDVDIGTVNHGVPYVGAGIVANGNGAIMGTATTGIEMGRVEEALHLAGD
jgi:translation initiation factor 6